MSVRAEIDKSGSVAGDEIISTGGFCQIIRLSIAVEMIATDGNC